MPRALVKITQPLDAARASFPHRDKHCGKSFSHRFLSVAKIITTAFDFIINVGRHAKPFTVQVDRSPAPGTIGKFSLRRIGDRVSNHSMHSVGNNQCLFSVNLNTTSYCSALHKGDICVYPGHLFADLG